MHSGQKLCKEVIKFSDSLLGTRTEIEIEEEKKEEAQLTPSELQRVVMELSRRVVKLERHHAKF